MPLWTNKQIYFFVPKRACISHSAPSLAFLASVFSYNCLHSQACFLLFSLLGFYGLFFISSSRLSNSLFWFYSPSFLCSSQTQPPFLSHPISCSTLSPSRSFVIPKYSWICGLPLECALPLRGYTFKESWPFLFQWLGIADSFLVRGGASRPIPPSLLRFCTV